MGEQLKGGCLCGAVRFTAVPTKMEMGVCHCSMCRRWSGGAFMEVNCDSVEVEDKTDLATFESSDWGMRQFCRKCGSTLFWMMKDGSHAGVAVGAFDDPEAFKFTTEIFVDEKPSNFDFANPTRKLTGAQVMELFASQQGPQHG